MRVLICGQKYFGEQVARMAMSLPGVQVAHVFAPFRAGRPDALYQFASVSGIPVSPAGSLCRATMPPAIDLIIAAHSHDFIGEQTRFASRLGGIGYHPSLLPRHRGRDAVEWTIRCADPVAGGSVYKLANHVDGGAVLCRDWCFVEPGETARELWRSKLCPMGVRLLRGAVTGIIATGAVVGKAQDESVATWEPAIGAAPLYRPDLLPLGYSGAAQS